MCNKKMGNVVLQCSVVIFLFQTAVSAGWNSSSVFDYDSDGVIGLGDFAIFAQNWGQMDPVLLEPDIIWVSISDPGVSGHEGFTGQMSKHETTNAQYCQFLNDAIATGDIVVSDNYVNGASGSNSGVDFTAENYYQLDGLGYTDNGATNGGAARINYSGGTFTVDGGFENHPVTFVSWYGAAAFCNYYGWRLPTEWQWQAVADYDGSYTYGCGTSINNSIANYYNSVHPDGTTAVGAFGVYGYAMADMAGNVWEWTSSIYDGSSRILRGGSWFNYGNYCYVSLSINSTPQGMCEYYGFRACRSQSGLGMTWVSISDPGVIGHEGFAGQMSKYETTNAQYCQFLNDAIATGDIVVSGNYVVGASGFNIGVDFAGENYYQLDGPGITYNGASNGGASRINYSGGVFTVAGGFDNYPVTYVSWYGSTAFCNYYGWQLPTEWQWQAAADYNGSYIYSCGTSINNSIANYYNSTHPDGTTAVGEFGAYGYTMADMAGNAYEWTSTVSGSSRVLRGGSWIGTDYDCTVSNRFNETPHLVYGSYGFRVCRSEPQPLPQPDITWVSIIDPGVSGHEGFAGQMSKYETTNAQYCQFLNDAIASGDVVVEGNYVNGASGSNSGVDFAGENYYQLDGIGTTYNGATNGGESRINYSDGAFTVDRGFENHPVTWVSWYGSTAFCNYYGWRLPTEWQWQAVADYNGSYTYGCGTSIDNSIANYWDAVHPYGTIAVGAFGVYGYGMADMAGNVWEWTSSIYSGISRVLRGGSWNYSGYYCTVSYRNVYGPSNLVNHNGFRVCR